MEHHIFIVLILIRFVVSSHGSTPDAYLFWPQLVLRVPLSQQDQAVDSWAVQSDEILGSGVSMPEGNKTPFHFLIFY